MQCSLRVGLLGASSCASCSGALVATAGSADIVVVLVAEAKLWECGLRSGCSWFDGPERVVDNEREEIWLPVGCPLAATFSYKQITGWKREWEILCAADSELLVLTTLGKLWRGNSASE